MEEDRLKRKWGHVIDTKKDDIEKSLIGALESASQMGTGFLVVKKERVGYYVSQKLWHEIKDELEKIGAIGAFGGRPE